MISKVQDLVQKIGWLNIMNPLKPNHFFELSHKYIDNRITTLRILEMSAAESGDQLKENPKTEILLVRLYAAIGRIVTEISNKILRVEYCEFGERTTHPNWVKRKEALSSFLIGTHPIDPHVYDIINMYKKLEAAGKIGVGPIDLQYIEYQKNAKKKIIHSKTNNFMGMGDASHNGEDDENNEVKSLNSVTGNHSVGSSDSLSETPRITL